MDRHLPRDHAAAPFVLDPSFLGQLKVVLVIVLISCLVLLIEWIALI